MSQMGHFRPIQHDPSTKALCRR